MHCASAYRGSFHKTLSRLAPKCEPPTKGQFISLKPIRCHRVALIGMSRRATKERPSAEGQTIWQPKSAEASHTSVEYVQSRSNGPRRALAGIGTVKSCPLAWPEKCRG